MKTRIKKGALLRFNWDNWQQDNINLDGANCDRGGRPIVDKTSQGDIAVVEDVFHPRQRAEGDNRFMRVKYLATGAYATWARPECWHEFGEPVLYEVIEEKGE